MKITAIIPLYMTTNDRVANNLRLYEYEIAPQYVPSLGGMSITTFSLSALFQLFQQGRAWWTQSNNEMPLIRYTGCTMYFYRADSSDYIVNYHNCYPMTPSLQTYNSTQPTIMQLNNRHIIVTCKKNNNHRKPYKKIKIKPPAQLTSKWFFQKDLANIPLLMLMCSTMSLDRFYLHSTAISSTFGFTGLNTNFFKYHDWYQTTTAGYFPQSNTYLWSFQQSAPYTPKKITEIKLKNLIFLGSTNTVSPGTTIGDTTTTDEGTKTDVQKKIDKYIETPGLWGNIFISFYIKGPGQIIWSKQHPRFLLKESRYYNQSSLETTLQETDFFPQTVPLLINYRYNPLADEGTGNKIYLKDTNTHEDNWDPPPSQEMQNNNLPLWIGLWGYIDFFKSTKSSQTIDTKKVLVLQTKYITPKTDTIVPIDDDVLQGYSPYRKFISGSDIDNWHPKTTFQYQTINKFNVSGPGTIKLPPNVSAEAHVRVKFYFKLGGCAAPTKNIEDPEIQPKFPTPNNILQPNSLQSPETSIDNFLYSFDWRRGYITPQATKRISNIEEIKKTFIDSTGINLLNPPTFKSTESSSDGETTEEEAEKETLQQLIHKYQQQQRKYRRRILQLMQSLE